MSRISQKKRLLCTVCFNGKYENVICTFETLWNIKLLFHLLSYLFITVHGIENKIQKKIKKPSGSSG